MANAFIDRTTVHAWSEDMSDNSDNHQSALTRLLKDQRRLTRFVEENAASMHPATGGIASYMIGVVTRMFDLAGGKLKAATWEQVRAAEAKVMAAVPELLPVDDDFADRARAVSWRAQPHILDEALMALFATHPDDLAEQEKDEENEENEEAADKDELFKIYLLMWVATEVLDGNWRPFKDFSGEAEYAYHHIAAKKRGDAEAPEA